MFWAESWAAQPRRLPFIVPAASSDLGSETGGGNVDIWRPRWCIPYIDKLKALATAHSPVSMSAAPMGGLSMVPPPLSRLAPCCQDGSGWRAWRGCPGWLARAVILPGHLGFLAIRRGVRVCWGLFREAHLRSVPPLPTPAEPFSVDDAGAGAAAACVFHGQLSW